MEILLAPVTEKRAKPVGGTDGLWRKQVLRHGSLNYKGRTLTFDRAYSEQLAKAFAEEAYDTVPFVLADEKNSHTMDPTRAKGEIVGFVPTDTGLDAILRLSEEAATIVKDNPKFGVSVRIVENLERGDGYKSPAAIQHVLGTFDPRMTGMSPWEAVEMSNDDAEVLDLTNLEDGEMPLTKDQEARLSKLLDLPDDKFAALFGESTEETQAELTDEEAAEIVAALEEDAKAETEDVEKVLTSLSNDTVDTDNADTSVELATLREENANTRRELTEMRWTAESRELLDLGVPPFMVELAAPVLKADTIELANGSDTIDIQGVVRGLLKGAAGVVDLTAEKGHQGSPEGDDLEAMHKAADAAGWGH